MKRLAGILLCVCTVGGVLWVLASGFAKMQDRSAFGDALAAHGIVADRHLWFWAEVFPWVEVFSGVGAIWMLVSRSNVAAASRIIAALFALFAIYVWFAHFSGASGKAGCGCGLRAGEIRSWIPQALQNTGIAIGFGLLSLAPSMLGQAGRVELARQRADNASKAKTFSIES